MAQPQKLTVITALAPNLRAHFLEEPRMVVSCDTSQIRTNKAPRVRALFGRGSQCDLGQVSHQQTQWNALCSAKSKIGELFSKPKLAYSSIFLSVVNELNGIASDQKNSFILPHIPGCILCRLRRRSSAWVSKSLGVLAHDRHLWRKAA